MKYCILVLLVILSCTVCSGQVAPPQETRPYVRMPNSGVLSLSVYTTGQTITFQNASDYSGSKTVPNYFRVNVKSPPVPWVLTAIIIEQYPNHSSGNAPDNAASLVSLRNEISGQTIRLSGTPQIILQSNNNLPDNDYTIDLIVDPPFDKPAGNLLETVIFQLELQ